LAYDWGTPCFSELLFARKKSASSEAGDVPVLNRTVLDVEGNSFYGAKLYYTIWSLSLQKFFEVT